MKNNTEVHSVKLNTYSDGVTLKMTLDGQTITVSIDAIDGKLRVLTGSSDCMPKSLTFPVNMRIGNFGSPE